MFMVCIQYFHDAHFDSLYTAHTLKIWGGKGKPTLAHVLAVGTDGEQNLVDALAHQFKSVDHLHCINKILRGTSMRKAFPKVPLTTCVASTKWRSMQYVVKCTYLPTSISMYMKLYVNPVFTYLSSVYSCPFLLPFNSHCDRKKICLVRLRFDFN